MAGKKIIILGADCNKCDYVLQFIEKTCKENNIEAEVEMECDMTKILDYGVMMTPAVVIDDEVVSVGRIPSKGEIRKWLGL